jgi:hypothetical protein
VLRAPAKPGLAIVSVSCVTGSARRAGGRDGLAMPGSGARRGPALARRLLPAAIMTRRPPQDTTTITMMVALFFTAIFAQWMLTA